MLISLLVSFALISQVGDSQPLDILVGTVYRDNKGDFTVEVPIDPWGDTITHHLVLTNKEQEVFLIKNLRNLVNVEGRGYMVSYIRMFKVKTVRNPLPEG